MTKLIILITCGVGLSILGASSIFYFQAAKYDVVCFFALMAAINLAFMFVVMKDPRL